MIAWTTWEYRWLLIAALVASLAISAIRMATFAGRVGRRPWVWFFVSLFFTALPATIVFWRDRAKNLSAGYARNDNNARHVQKNRRPDGEVARREKTAGCCPHCGAILDAADQAGGECPRCRMSIDTGRYA